MAGKVHHFFAGDHTAKGFYPLYAFNYQGLERVFILQGLPYTGKSSLMEKLADEWKDEGFDIEMIHSSSDNQAVDGVIIPQLKMGIYGGETPLFVFNDENLEYINMDTAVNFDSLNDKKDTITQLKEKMKNAYQEAQNSFKAGLDIHDDLEDVYINQMNFTKANQLTNQLIHQLFNNQKAANNDSVVKRRFFGASTPQGVVDYIPNLTEDLDKRYFIKGRAGTGKSTILKKIAAAGENLGFNVEIYHCGFDPLSLDMVIIRELGFCVFDSTDPHEYFPDREGDEIVDVYAEAVTPGTDEKYADEIDNLTRGYKSYMKEGVAYLKEAKQHDDELAFIYRDAVNTSVTDRIFESIHLEFGKKASILE
ncbi:PRK06851 family protein [Halobacillus shinanisalinarum]|uniref:PRK06851 family protein n=1 Tax=Halobacillus shinanisalinarum TaxID=2932258 RepID=A0ABY4H224_9BACI|nr:PRK06851 family protein [Halobacillus shinanisalinarum]UOQ94497.1 PRK06851 family protein [Halobacillus shinanisalinarum]